MTALCLALVVLQAPAPPTAWQVVPSARCAGAEVSGDGLHCLTHDLARSGATLWDVSTGARVASFDGPCVLEDTGRYVLVLRQRARDTQFLEELLVVDARSGRIASEALAIGEGLAGPLSARWTAEPLGEVGHLEGPWFGVRRFEIDGGTLSVYLPLARTAIANAVTLDVRADGQRALLRYRGRSSWYALLVDPRERLPLAKWASSGGARFTADGRWVADQVLPDVDEVSSFDAQTGRREAHSLHRATFWLGLDPQPVAVNVAAATVVIADGRELEERSLPTQELRRSVRLQPPLALPVDASNTRLAAYSDVFVIEHRREVRGFDAGNGQLRWVRAGALVPAKDAAPRDTAVVLESAGSLAMLDVRDGRVIAESRRGLSSTRRAVALVAATSDGGAGTEVALVTTDDGGVFTFEPRSGATLGRSALHRGRAVDFVAPSGVAPAASIVTGDEQGRVVVHALPRLQELRRLELGADTEVLAADAAGAWLLHAPRERSAQYEVVLRSLMDGEARCKLAVAGAVRALTSECGELVALLAGRRVVALSTSTAQVVADFELPAEISEVATAAALHGTEALVLGRSHDLWVSGSWCGVEVFDLKRGERVATHRAAEEVISVFGEEVARIQSWPQHARLVYVVAPSKRLIALDTETWAEVGSIELQHRQDPVCAPPGVDWALVGRSIVDARTLSPRSDEALGAPRARIGCSGGASLVSQWGSEERELRRWELAGGGALLQDAAGRYRSLDAPDAALADVHVRRAGVSAPLASFLALRDEEGWIDLGPASEPPWFVSGPPRVVHCAGGALALDIAAAGPRGVAALLARAEGRAPQRAAFSKDGRARLELAGPWPVEVELVAVDPSGVTSRPWRVRVVQE